MQVEVHIDDFGLYPCDLDALDELHRSGYLQGVSLVANGASLESASRFVHDHPRLQCTVHLNLLEGPALCPRTAVQLLVDRNGIFRHSFLSLWSFHTSERERRRELGEQIERELGAQVKLVRERCGRRTVGLDSHRYVHLLPFVWPLMLEDRERLAVSGIRTVREPWAHIESTARLASPCAWVNRAKQLLLNRLSSPLTRALDEIRVDHPDYYAGVAASGRMTTRAVGETLEAIRRKTNGDCRVEVVFHPLRLREEPGDHQSRTATTGGAGAVHTRFYRSDERAAEMRVLQSPEFRRVIDAYRGNGGPS